MEICVAAAVEALWEKERQDETRFTTKIDSFLSFTPHPPPFMLKYLFSGFKKNLTLFMTKNSGLWCCVFLTLLTSLLL